VLALPPWRRAAARRAAHKAGLAVLDEVVAIPRGPSWRELLSLRSEAAAPLGHAIARPSTVGRVVGAAVATRLGRRVIALAAPGLVMLVARRAGTSRHWRGPDAGAGLHVRRGERDDAGTVVAQTLAAGQVPVVKVGLDAAGRARIAREGTLGLAVAATTPPGLATPHIVGGPAWALSLSPVSGRRASEELRHDPAPAGMLFDELAGLVTAWQRETLRAGRDASWLARVVDEPVQRLRGAEPALAGYLDEITDLARAVDEKDACRLVATHGDLTMTNVLVAPSGLGLVDWESADHAGLALTDLWYALADIAVWALRKSRVAAVRVVAQAADPWNGLSRINRAAIAVDVAPDARRLAFHLTWIMHAANEVERRSGAGPFVDVVRDLAATGFEPTA
jgi:hypothetical protein